MQTDFVRSKNNPGAVINTNNTALQRYKITKKKMKKVSTLENKVDRLTALVEQLLEKSN